MPKLDELSPASRPESASITSRKNPLSSRTSKLERLYSGQHFEDQSYYHEHDNQKKNECDKSSPHGKRFSGDGHCSCATEQKDSQGGEKGSTSDEEIEAEGRGEPLGKEKTTRSIVDPDKLVCICVSELEVKLICYR